MTVPPKSLNTLLFIRASCSASSSRRSQYSIWPYCLIVSGGPVSCGATSAQASRSGYSMSDGSCRTVSMRIEVQTLLRAMASPIPPWRRELRARPVRTKALSPLATWPKWKVVPVGGACSGFVSPWFEVAARKNHAFSPEAGLCFIAPICPGLPAVEARGAPVSA